jgi:hypothetical protein
MMNLPEAFRHYGTAVFSDYPQITHAWSAEKRGRCRLSLPANSPVGFDIEFIVDPDEVTLCWGSWHTHFEPEDGVEALVEELFGLLRDMLSPDMRIRELYKWPFAYRGFLESFDGTTWWIEHETGQFFWNYFGRRSVRIYSNSLLPGRLSGPDQDASAD